MKRLFYIVAAIVCTLLLISVSLFLFFFPGFEPIPFSKQAWHQADHEQRGHMVDDLLKRKTLEGLTQEEVLELLGPPDQSTSVEEQYERLSPGFNPERLKNMLGEPAPGRLCGMSYKIGYREVRSSVPMAFGYLLSVQLKNGKVERAFFHD